MKYDKCKICNEPVTIRSMAMHLKWSHKIKTEEYVKLYGEFRPKKLNEINIKNKSTFKCKICNEIMMHQRQLFYHLTKHHKNISREEYILKHYYNNVKPLCKCGCGGETNFLPSGIDNNFYAKYIKGHWDWIVPGYNNHNEATKDIIRQASKNRANKERTEFGYQKMHSPETLANNRHNDKLKYSELLIQKYNIELTNPFDIYSSTHPGNYFKFRCLGCKITWQQKSRIPNCQKCNPPSHLEISSEEKEIQDIILSYYPLAEFNVRHVIPPYELDIYIPELKLAIEYNGLYWHSEDKGKHKYYHLNKTIMCRDSGIQLIHIFSDEWLNNKDIVKSRLYNILNVTPNKLYARKCVIKEIDVKCKTPFLNNNHIQGTDKSKIKLGLYNNDELVSVMTFGAPRVAMGNKNKIYNKDDYELIRFCNKINTNVVGGASKLFKYFINNYKPQSIFSFADNRWSNPTNNVYLKLGFNLKSESKPGYWYTKNFKQRYHRFNFSKNRLKAMGHMEGTESQIMSSLKYEKIWDCGVSRFEWTL
jgi:hypothetical protein